jgi:hypothetical protein
VVSGRARMRWGDKLEFVAEAGPGDFIYVPPYVPHQEINANDDEPLSCVLVRSGRSRGRQPRHSRPSRSRKRVHWWTTFIRRRKPSARSAGLASQDGRPPTGYDAGRIRGLAGGLTRWRRIVSPAVWEV